MDPVVRHGSGNGPVCNKGKHTFLVSVLPFLEPFANIGDVLSLDGTKWRCVSLYFFH